MVKCACCDNSVHPATGHFHSEKVALCGVHARDFWNWYKARMGAMHARLRNKRTGKKCKESFADVAARSIVAD